MYDKYTEEVSEKDRIFNIAVGLLEKVGYENMSVRRICKDADISVGKFYTYFQNKQEILLYFYEQAEQKLNEKIQKKDFSQMTLQKKIVVFYTIYMEYISSFGVEFVMHYFDHQNSAMDIHHNNNFIMEVTDRFMMQAVQNGYQIPRGRGIHDLSIDICMIAKGVIFTWVAERGGFSLSEVTGDLLERTLAGILP